MHSGSCGERSTKGSSEITTEWDSAPVGRRSHLANSLELKDNSIAWGGRRRQRPGAGSTENRQDGATDWSATFIQ